MTVSQLAGVLEAKILSGSEKTLAREVTGAYAGDLLSWVMGRAGAGAAWVTIMSTQNVAAVALLTEAACVVLSEGVIPDEALMARAIREDIALLSSPVSTYGLCWRIHGAIG